MIPKFFSVFLSVISLAALSLHAEEKNGLMLTVTKKTLERADSGSGGANKRGAKTQALKVVMKNTSSKEKPEGEVQWMILSRPYASSPRVKYYGTEPLKALNPSEILDMVVGASSHAGSLDYQVIVTHGGVETVRVESVKSFDSLAELAEVSSAQRAMDAQKKAAAEAALKVAKEKNDEAKAEEAEAKKTPDEPVSNSPADVDFFNQKK